MNIKSGQNTQIITKIYFGEFYTKKLPCNLKSWNESHEHAMLSKMKQQCGFQFTSKMKSMVESIYVMKKSNIHEELKHVYVESTKWF